MPLSGGMLALFKEKIMWDENLRIAYDAGLDIQQPEELISCLNNVVGERGHFDSYSY